MNPKIVLIWILIIKVIPCSSRVCGDEISIPSASCEDYLYIKFAQLEKLCSTYEINIAHLQFFERLNRPCSAKHMVMFFNLTLDLYSICCLCSALRQSQCLQKQQNDLLSLRTYKSDDANCRDTSTCSSCLAL